jgi:hypothetical protein
MKNERTESACTGISQLVAVCVWGGGGEWEENRMYTHVGESDVDRAW